MMIRDNPNRAMRKTQTVVVYQCRECKKETQFPNDYKCPHCGGELWVKQQETRRIVETR